MNKKSLNILPEETPGQIIRKLRQTARLSQRELGEILGFTANYLGQIERGARELSKNVADAICDYFHVTYGDLYRQEETPGTINEDSAYICENDMCKNKNLVIEYIKSCSEEECQQLEPVIHALVQSLRDTDWFSYQPPDTQKIMSDHDQDGTRERHKP